MTNGRTREISVAGIILLLFALLGVRAPEYFSRANLQDMFLSNVPVLLVALGMTLVILTRQIDISVGSVFAISSVACGVFAKWGLPVPLAALAAGATGAALGSLNGLLVAYLRIPSIIVTLAAMVAWRDALRWTTQGAWIEDLPSGFQWLGLPQSAYPAAMFALALVLVGTFAWGLRNLAAGRAVFATGSNAETARLAGIPVASVTFLSFAVLGALSGLAAALNSVRFNQIPSNTGLGLEMKVIAAVLVGGTAITGGTGSIGGTVLGVILMGAIGPALTFLGVSAYWEKAIQGGIILATIGLDATRAYSRKHRLEKHGSRLATNRT